jgi:hypothetical protein
VKHQATVAVTLTLFILTAAPLAAQSSCATTRDSAEHHASIRQLLASPHAHRSGLPDPSAQATLVTDEVLCRRAGDELTARSLSQPGTTAVVLYRLSATRYLWVRPNRNDGYAVLDSTFAVVGLVLNLH